MRLAIPPETLFYHDHQVADQLKKHKLSFCRRGTIAEQQTAPQSISQSAERPLIHNMLLLSPIKPVQVIRPKRTWNSSCVGNAIRAPF
jgi:hypothetical protein